MWGKEEAVPGYRLLLAHVLILWPVGPTNTLTHRVRTHWERNSALPLQHRVLPCWINIFSFFFFFFFLFFLFLSLSLSLCSSNGATVTSSIWKYDIHHKKLLSNLGGRGAPGNGMDQFRDLWPLCPAHFIDVAPPAFFFFLIFFYCEWIKSMAPTRKILWKG